MQKVAVDLIHCPMSFDGCAVQLCRAGSKNDDY